MLENGDYRQVRDALLSWVMPVEIETIPLEKAAGRVLAQTVTAQADIPPFDRSPYDGYAFRSEDVAAADEAHPVTLRIVDYIAAGAVPHTKIGPGMAAHLMTGAPVPEGADAVLPFEKTSFTEETVTISTPVKADSNIVRAGEDVKKGIALCSPGTRIDAGLAGTLAGQGIFRPEVFRTPLVGIISTGSELLEEGEAPAPGRIYNTNRYALQAACAQAGCESLYIGTARDREEEISAMIRKALSFHCDMVLLSGGVSVGDYDCTPAAMEAAGVEILARGVALKPGMAGAYGICRKASGDETEEEYKGQEEQAVPVIGLSGNPAACMTAFYAVTLPVLKKRMGLAEVLPARIRVRMKKDYSRKNQSARLLRGQVDFSSVTQEITISPRQGNQMLASLAGSNAMAEIPAGASVEAGEEVEAFLL